jgi:3-deoxy-manno-octulosonate cytidylyltransferase (CMP-KDO synthetase)
VIATDDMRIAKAAFSWGAEVALTSSRHRSGTDRVAEVARTGKQFAIIVNIQGDEPLVDPRLIDRLVHTLRTRRDVDIVTAAHAFEDPDDINSPHQVKVLVDRFGHALDFSRTAPGSGDFQVADFNKRPAGARRSLKSRVLRHQGIYGFRRAALMRFVKAKQTPRERAEALEQLRALENGVKVHVLVTTHGSPGIDTPADAKALERKLARAKGTGVVR